MAVRVLCSTGDGLELRTLHRGLAARIFQTVDAERGQLGRWLPWVHATQGLPDTVKFIQNARDLFLHGEGIHGAIWDQDEFVGMMALRMVSKADRIGNVGYWLCARAQGRGIITRLLGNFVGYCFEEWKLHRLELQCAAANERSCRVAERLGFRHEGLLRGARLINGAYLDMNLFSLLEPEWRARAPQAATNNATSRR
ncbi:MAG: GNAT family N-acetyltransferase [Bryobacterales bacterium]|nr:GNAT family N-acetyltransferase [Bryobacterales bacterium]